ncbi:TPA: DUF2591 family protein [Morganella morganii]|nr:DUF2591 domain-containing protein [Morganella morganii]HDF2364408.1 DUF2591 family protein [Morganella morganii]HDF2423030.1 DUF2591 family protein [Morganella morganii]
MNKYRDKSDFEINVLVAKLELMKITLFHVYDAKYSDEKESMIYLVGSKWCEAELLDYCNNPADAMPIIIENNIDLLNGDNQMPELFGHHSAYTLFDFSHPIASDSLKERKTIYRLAMEVFLMMKEAENEKV